MGIAHGRVEFQRILIGVDRFLQFPYGCEGSPQVIPDGCGCLGITLRQQLVLLRGRQPLQHGLVMGDGFIMLSLFRECETEVGLGCPISHGYIQGVLEKSDAVMPVSELRTGKPGAQHQGN